MKWSLLARLVIAVSPVLFLFPCVSFADEAHSRTITLEDALKSAVANNFDVAIERINASSAREERITAEAEFDPVAGAAVFSGKSVSPSTSALANPDIIENRNASAETSVSGKVSLGTQYKLSLTARQDETNSSFQSLNPYYTAGLKLEASQPILKNFGPSVNRWKIITGRNREEMAALKLKAAMADLVTNVNQAYLELSFQVENLKAQKEALERAKDLLKRTEAQVEAGALAQIEITSAKASAASWEEKVIAAENAMDTASDNLLKLIGKSGDGEEWSERLVPAENLADKTLPAEGLDMGELLKSAVESRPEVMIAKKELENKNVELVYRKNQKWPSLDVVGTLNLNGVRGDAQETVSLSGTGTTSGLSPLGGGWNDSWGDASSGKYYDYSIGLRLTYPLGRRADTAQEAIASFNMEAALLKLKVAERDVMLETREASRSFESGGKQVDAARAARELAEERLKGETTKFEVGATTLFSVLEYHKELTVQRTVELKALADRRKAAARLYRAVGLALEKQGIEMETLVK